MRLPLVVQLTPEAKSAIESVVLKVRGGARVFKARTTSAVNAFVAPVEIPVEDLNTPPTSVRVEIHPGL